jgi:carbon-monoxide dehydrogenase large subunit
VIEVAKYTMVNDFGVVINPPIVEGQAHGGVAQGIGQVLYERVVYDENGQPLAGSFMDYAMPRADTTPDMTLDFHPSPSTTNALGAKGCGEAGCAGALPAMMGAIGDALLPLGITHIDMPCTPEVVWRMIRDARKVAA